MIMGYRVVERFSPSSGASWAKYIAGSGLSGLTEVVGLDASLCPPLLHRHTDQDSAHAVFGGNFIGCFDDLDYALSRLDVAFDPERHQVLAVAREPVEADVMAAELPGFRFKGFELIADEESAFSALTNCGGFDLAFGPDDLSECGLVRTAARAYEIAESLGELYPDEPHADCTVWALWRQEGAGSRAVRA
jgi:hypothetical protein